MSMRRRVVLDGAWQFFFDTAGNVTLEDLPSRASWRNAMVPMPWQAQFPELRHQSGVGWYRRLEALPPVKADQAAILHFGAVDYHATVWVNGQYACEHEGGYLPFEADITALLVSGENEIVVRVLDPHDDAARWSPYRFSEIPHGKQSWYGQMSGIWQSVWLEFRALLHLRSSKLTPDLAHGTVDVAVVFARDVALGEDQTVEIALLDAAGAIVATSTATAQAAAKVGVVLKPDRSNVRPWSPDDPVLYTVRITLHQAGQMVDRLEESCGFRTVEAYQGRIYLNGQPLYLRGVLDQAYYPATLYTPPSKELLERQLRQAKALGFNCLRCHIKIEDPRYYEVADRLGMLIWAEVPNWMHLSPAAAARAEATFAAMVQRDWNHPSIIIWTLVNEDWGTDLVNDDRHRQWLADFFQRAKALDPTRLIVDNSACWPNAHVASDLEDYHHYRVLPDHAAEWNAWVADFASRPVWSWYAGYAALRQPDAPLIVSEFGNWGLFDPHSGEEPTTRQWALESGYDWGDGLAAPAGVEARFAAWQLARVFGTFTAFIHASQQQMARSLAYEITAMRSQPAIGGYVVTELTDVQWEANGLMDIERNVKQGVGELVAPVNGRRAILIQPDRWSASPNEKIVLRLSAVDGATPATEGRLRWQMEGASGEVQTPHGEIVIHPPAGAVSRMFEVAVTWLHEEQCVATNHIELACIVTPPWEKPLVAEERGGWASGLADVGYRVTQAPADSAVHPLILTTTYSEAVQTRIRAGAHVLWLATAADGVDPGKGPTFVGADTRVVARAGTWWQGDWASSFSWLHKQGPFAHLPGGPLLGMEYAEIMPRSVLAMEPHRLNKRDVWAGLAVGWLHKVVGLAAYGSYGQGALVIATFHLTPDVLRRTAAARGLLRGLIELTATGGQPRVPSD